jgi:hypothetical protein
MKNAAKKTAVTQNTVRANPVAVDGELLDKRTEDMGAAAPTLAIQYSTFNAQVGRSSDVAPLPAAGFLDLMVSVPFR